MRELLRRVDKAGLRVAGQTISGGHIHLQLVAPNGEQRMFVCPASPSDRRGQLNQLAMWRRFARENSTTKETA